MKKTAPLILILSAVMLCQGCSFPQKYKIEETQNILIFGVDSKGDEMQVTIVVDSIKESASAGEEQVTYKAYTMTGQTVFEISRNLHALTDKRISYYHLKYVIIGEEAARKGITECLNFILEDHEPVFTHRLLITRGITAKEFIEQASPQSSSLADYLDSLSNDLKNTGKSSEVRVIDYAIAMKRPWISLYIPVVEPDTSSVVQAGNSQNSQSVNVKLEGYAIFNGDRLAGFMDGDTAMGANFIINELHGACITVQDIKGQSASIEVIDSRAKIIPDFSDPLSATIKVSVKANLVDYNIYADISEEEFLRCLEQQGRDNILNKIEKAIVLAQQNDADMLGVGEAFHHKDPIKWQSIESGWPAIFGGMVFFVEVTLEIKGTYYFGAVEEER